MRQSVTQMESEPCQSIVSVSNKDSSSSTMMPRMNRSQTIDMIDFTNINIILGRKAKAKNKKKIIPPFQWFDKPVRPVRMNSTHKSSMI